MKAKLIYEFELPQDRREMLKVMKGPDTISALWEFQEHTLRHLIKYQNDLESADEALKRVREEFFECLRDRGVDIYELTGS